MAGSITPFRQSNLRRPCNAGTDGSPVSVAAHSRPRPWPPVRTRRVPLVLAPCAPSTATPDSPPTLAVHACPSSGTCCLRCRRLLPPARRNGPCAQRARRAAPSGGSPNSGRPPRRLGATSSDWSRHRSRPPQVTIRTSGRPSRTGGAQAAQLMSRRRHLVRVFCRLVGKVGKERLQGLAVGVGGV